VAVLLLLGALQPTLCYCLLMVLLCQVVEWPKVGLNGAKYISNLTLPLSFM
jgi:hypothetical protein